MLAATFLAIFFVPYFYKLITEKKLREERSSAELKREASHHREIMRHSTPLGPTRHTPRTEGSDD